jgi:hypothetical protein
MTVLEFHELVSEKRPCGQVVPIQEKGPTEVLNCLRMFLTSGIVIAYKGGGKLSGDEIGP